MAAFRAWTCKPVDLLALVALFPAISTWAAEESGTRWTLESIAQRYALKLKIEKDTFQANGNGVRIRGKAGDDRIEVNRLSYRLLAPWKGTGSNFAQQDISDLLDPLLQPSRHIEAPHLQEVYVDVAESGIGASAERIIAMLRSILQEYQLNVRSGEAAPAEGNFLWLRLNPSAEGDLRISRCLVLKHSDPEKTGGGILPGEFFDAESLILATLIQTGMVLGPGAAGGSAVDGGIERTALKGMGDAAAPAICLEWGSALDPEHVVKSLAAGILRFQQFLGSDARNQGNQGAFGKREMKLSRVDLRNGPGANEVHFLLSVSGKSKDLSSETTSKIEIPSRFFVKDEDGLIRMLPDTTMRLDWGEITQVPGDEGAMATVRATFSLSEKDSARLHSGFLGYAVWLVRNGVIEDRKATPDRLTDQLWRWENN